MTEIIETAHKVYEVTTSDMFSLMVASFMAGSLITDTFGCIVRFIVKKIKEKKYE